VGGPPRPRVGRHRTPTATGRAAPDRGHHGHGRAHAGGRRQAGEKRVGLVWPVGPERRPGLLTQNKIFLFQKSISKFSTQSKFQILEEKMTFSKVDRKTKVVQNLILYNFELGHSLKFQTYFEFKIQSPFFK
jgi:hypothetical protein